MLRSIFHEYTVGTVITLSELIRVRTSLLALGHLVRVLGNQPQFPTLSRGEIVTTGTLTDAWPVRRGETWSSDYGELGLPGLRLNLS